MGVTTLLVTLLLVTFSSGQNVPLEINQDFTFSDLKRQNEVLQPENLLNPDNFAENSTCKEDLQKYVIGLLTLKQWALQMFDATAKIPEGISYGNHMYLGQYDECLAVFAANNSFKGQHCLLRITPKSLRSPITLQIFYGMCLPSTCSATDINQGMSFVGNSGLISVTVEENDCHIDEAQQLSTGAWVVIGVLIIFGFLGLLSTIYDVMHRPDSGQASGGGKPHPLLSSFSLYNNGKALLTTNSGGDQISCLNGIRVISTIWVVSYHSHVWMLLSPTINFTKVLGAPKEPIFAVLMNANVAVDSFYVLSGLLLGLSFLRTIQRSGTYDVPLSYIHRYLRLASPYAMVILLQATIFQYFGDGPAWNYLQDPQTSACVDNWWTGLLFVQNYVNPKNMCLNQTWYLSADMQMYWLSPLLLFPIWKWRKFAPVYLIFVIAVFTFLPFTIAYIDEYPPLPPFDTSKKGLENMADNFGTHHRAASWLVGVALAYLINELKQRKIKVNLSKIWIIFGWMLAAALAGISLFGIILFETDDGYTPGEKSFAAAFYYEFHRLGWALGVAWLIFACMNGMGGFINTFLSWGFFQPLGKLSYGIYLTHTSVAVYRYGILRNSAYFNIAEGFFNTIAVFMTSVFVSILLYLFVEAPFFIIERHLLQNVKILPLPCIKSVKSSTN